MTWTTNTGRLAAAIVAAGLGAGCAAEDSHGTRDVALTRERAGPPGTSINRPDFADPDFEKARLARQADQQRDQLITDRQKAEDDLRHPALARFARTLPAFTLKDPHGRPLERDALLGPHGAVFIVTAPIMGEGDEQEAWTEALANAAPGGASWVLVEDMSQTTFKGIARDRMKKEYDPSKRPFLAIDEEGQVRKQLGVAEGETVVLSYDAQGKLKHCETGDASYEGARRAWTVIQGELGEPHDLNREIDREMQRE